MIEVDYTELTPLTSPYESLKGDAPLIHPDGNIIAAGGDRQYAYTNSEYTQGAVTKLTSVTHDHNGTVSTNSHYHEIDLTTSSAGSGSSVNNMQPYLAVNYYIYTGRPLI